MTKYDVVGIGNAIVDVLAKTEDVFLIDNGLTKGTMSIIDSAEAAKLYSLVQPSAEISGGSAANTRACLASLGGTGAFCGKVSNDNPGKIFKEDIQKLGIYFETLPNIGKPATARSFIFVTPDAERTMQTYLGACVELGPDDINETTISNSAVTYLEGYLWDPPQAKEAFIKAAAIAHDADRKVALSLSDPFCVSRHREELLSFITEHVNILFGNEEEIKTLLSIDNFTEAAVKMEKYVEIAALTRGKFGSLVVGKDAFHEIEACPVEKVIDTTGAGDAYAAGFLFGYTKGYSMANCAEIGSAVSAEIITHYGARPKQELSRVINGNKLI
ncbi:MAG: adenosine kinase [Pseudomonadota bacterium]|nr:adenosine kinase [Pseudomonadota bacterium]